ncbi:GGDEF domain-containing protein [Acinetobacter baumannii]|uniref:GGDEF domain-containing protein n=1 Tax=Acinetobacter baumannii TaxID=470 RepID=UPI000DE79CC9|nr:GGDEF domain-containing protein [Acinetobacter baumannii]EKT9378662.1 GGDEF domain-containing protein [Acinetobacter baumannii]EKU0757504.1 GGDEF domain-containing protein [Acinetobacter baumannii]EKV8391591.1 GGDEF domain-containing protein [Acinetobacter baumannii]EKW0728096.1 GGDEF domain-containing protein [Acinetobacter baumannii]EKW0736960.1 GGDEF domain-containing protein [Acinetobacter baumannii]
MSGLRSEHISNRLFFFMLVIILSLLFMAVPLIVSSYQEYLKTKQALVEIKSLRSIAEVANKVSKERAPANKLMSSNAADFLKNQKNLKEYRLSVDRQLNETIHILKEEGYADLANTLNTKFRDDLKQARAVVDYYVATPEQARSSIQFDNAILAMFGAWDSCREVLQNLMLQLKSKDSQINNYFTLIVVLTDMRDQAGRTASNVIAPVTFKETIPNDNRARSLQTQQQARYLWALVDTLQSEQAKTPEYHRLYSRVKTEFLDKGVPIVGQLLDESQKHQAYHLNGTELTDQIVDKFTTVIDLQKFLLNKSVLIASQENYLAKKKFFLTLLISSISLAAALLTLIYAKRRVFEPLIQARTLILDLSHSTDYPIDELKPKKGEFISLFEAIDRLQRMLKQRDAFEFQLKNIANTDPLTGVSNRLALSEYLKIVESYPQKFSQTCLMIIDIDRFKYVNDQYGHIVGDQVIRRIADQLKANVRASDLIVRYGGDEFLILLEQVQFLDARLLAEKIRIAISLEEIDLSSTQEKLHVSVSIGFAIGATSWMELLENADRSLLRAKARGRNVVEG